jgi:uncharacterized protein YndB with AHSA1/START domain
MSIVLEKRLVIERIFDAEIELLWKCWTEPQYIGQWFGSDPHGTVEKVDLDLRVGGKYRIEFSDSDHSVHICKGEYTNIEHLKKLEMSWEWESEPNQISQLKVEFAAIENNAKVILTHSNIEFESIHNYAHGWNGALYKIEINIIKIVQQ